MSIKQLTKHTITLLLTMICLTALTGCGIPNPPSEAQIEEHIANDTYILNYMDEYSFEKPFTITKLTVNKRQTNKDNKEDTLYCAIELENGICTKTADLELYFNYYDQGGWILDDYSEKNVTYSPLAFPSETLINNYMEILQSQYTKVEYLPLNETAQISTNVELIFDVQTSFDNYDIEGKSYISMLFNSEIGHWTYIGEYADTTINWDKVLGTYTIYIPDGAQKGRFESDTHIYISIDDYDENGFYLSSYSESPSNSPSNNFAYENLYVPFEFKIDGSNIEANVIDRIEAKVFQQGAWDSYFNDPKWHSHYYKFRINHDSVFLGRTKSMSYSYEVMDKIS